MKKLITLAILFCWCGGALASNYFVTQSGAGARNGQTPRNAWSVSDFSNWETWDPTGANPDDINPGDTVYFLDTITGTPETANSGGALGNPVTLRGDFPGRKCLFDGQNNLACGLRILSNYITVKNMAFQDYIQINSREGAIMYSGKHDITVTNCTFSNSTAANSEDHAHLSSYVYTDQYNITITNNVFHGSGYGVRFYQGNASLYNVTVQDNTFGINGETKYPVTAGSGAPYDWYYVGGGMKIDSHAFSGTPAIHDIDISNNTLHHTRYRSISVATSDWAHINSTAPYNIIVYDNEIYNSGGYPVLVKTGPSGTGSIVRGNVINGGGVLKMFSSNGIEVMGSQNLIVSQNTVSRQYTATPSGDAIGIILDHLSLPSGHVLCDGVIVEHNIIYDNDYNNSGWPTSGIQLYRAKNCIIRFNLVYDCGSGYVLSWASNTGNVFYNNVSAYNQYGAYIYGEAPASTWKNNIIAHNTGYGFYMPFTAWGDDDAALPSESYNCLYDNNDRNYIDSRTGSEVAVDLHGNDISSDPLFVNTALNNYRLKPLSPCINTGTNPFSPGDGNQVDLDNRLVFDDETDSVVGPWKSGVEIGAYSYFYFVPLKGWWWIWLFYRN